MSNLFKIPLKPNQNSRVPVYNLMTHFWLSDQTRQKNTYFYGRSLCETMCVKPMINLPPIWEWLIQTIYGGLGDGLLCSWLLYPHKTQVHKASFQCQSLFSVSTLVLCKHNSWKAGSKNQKETWELLGFLDFRVEYIHSNKRQVWNLEIVERTYHCQWNIILKYIVWTVLNYNPEMPLKMASVSG